MFGEKASPRDKETRIIPVKDQTPLPRDAEAGFHINPSFSAQHREVEEENDAKAKQSKSTIWWVNR